MRIRHETNGVAKRAGALAEAEALVEQAGEVRQRLQEDRAALAEQIRAIDAMLAKLPSVGAPAKGQAAPRPAANLPTGRTDTIPGLLLAIIGAQPGILSRDMLPFAQRKRPKLQMRDIHANLYRLQHKKQRIRTEGPRGETRYFLAEPAVQGGVQTASPN